MPHFGKKSIDRLNTCDERLIKIMHNVIELYDFSVLCGHRGEKEQNEAYASGASKAKWGQSKHNTKPSKAIDIAPYDKGINWQDTEAFTFLATLVLAEAQKQGVKVKWGGHFKGFYDGVHFELMED